MTTTPKTSSVFQLWYFLSFFFLVCSDSSSPHMNQCLSVKGSQANKVPLADMLTSTKVRSFFPTEHILKPNTQIWRTVSHFWWHILLKNWAQCDWASQKHCGRFSSPRCIWGLCLGDSWCRAPASHCQYGHLCGPLFSNAPVWSPLWGC